MLVHTKNQTHTRTHNYCYVCIMRHPTRNTQETDRERHFITCVLGFCSRNSVTSLYCYCSYVYIMRHPTRNTQETERERHFITCISVVFSRNYATSLCYYCSYVYIMRHPTRNTQETERERDFVNDIIIQTCMIWVGTLGHKPKETHAQKTQNTQETLKKHRHSATNTP